MNHEKLNMSVRIWAILWSISQFIEGSWVDDFVYVPDTANFSTTDVYNDGWYVVHTAAFKIKSGGVVIPKSEALATLPDYILLHQYCAVYIGNPPIINCHRCRHRPLFAESMTAPSKSKATTLSHSRICPAMSTQCIFSVNGLSASQFDSSFDHSIC